jgi:two-component system response regulator HydG
MGVTRLFYGRDLRLAALLCGGLLFTACAGGEVIGVDDVMPVESMPPKSKSQPQTLADIVDNAEREAIEAALQETSGNRERTAELLGISPTTLWRKMTRLGVRSDG